MVALADLGARTTDGARLAQRWGDRAAAAQTSPSCLNHGRERAADLFIRFARQFHLGPLRQSHQVTPAQPGRVRDVNPNSAPNGELKFKVVNHSHLAVFGQGKVPPSRFHGVVPGLGAAVRVHSP